LPAAFAIGIDGAQGFGAKDAGLERAAASGAVTLALMDAKTLRT